MQIQADDASSLLLQETERITWLFDMDSYPCDEWLAIEKSPGELFITVQKLWTPSLLQSDPHDRCDKWVGVMSLAGIDVPMVYLTRNDRIEIIAKALWDIVDQRGDYCIHIPWENVPADDKAEWRGRAAEVLDDLRLEMCSGK